MEKDQNCIELVCSTWKAAGETWVRLIPDGEVDSVNGNFFLDGEGAEEAIRSFKERGVDIVVDYEHGSLPEFRRSDAAVPAAGWIHQLRYEEGEGLYGLVRWTEEAFRMITAGEYRYLSPTVLLERDSRRVVGLDSAALTHKPAIKGGLPVAAARYRIEETMIMGNPTKQKNQEGTEGGEVTPDQKIGQITELLKGKGVDLPEGASREAVLDAVIAFLRGEGGAEEGGGGETEVAAAVRRELGLKADAPPEQVMLALSQLKGRAGADGKLLALQRELEELKSREAQRNAEELVASAIKENKLNPHNAKQMEWARQSALKDPEGFKNFVACATPYVEPGQTQPPAASGSRGGRKEEELIASALKEHNGRYGEALFALQKRLIDEECERTGLERKRAVRLLEKQYPVIFGEAA